MKKIKLLPMILIIVLTTACEEKVVQGTNSLIKILEEPAGNNCINGGSKVITGIDINDNGILNEDEIQDSIYLCNGIDGVNTILDVLPEPSGENCSNGGFRVVTGIDINGNSILDEDEIEHTEYICTSSDGVTTLLEIVPEPAGDNCLAGGYLVLSGLDLNNDNTLNNDEIQNYDYICNGEDGDDFYMFCATKPEDWSCQIYQNSFENLPMIQGLNGDRLEDPLAVIIYSNETIGCTDYNSLYLHVYNISKKEALEEIIEFSNVYSWCVPEFFGENEKYYIITSPCFMSNWCFTDEDLHPLFQAIKGLFTVSVIDD